VPDTTAPDLARLAAELVGGAVEAVRLAGAGRNGRVYRVDAAGGPFAMKFYPAAGRDGRDRLGTEYGAYAFLHGAGIHLTPRPLARLDAAGAALYDWIEGTPVGRPSDADIAAAADFARQLRTVSANQAARSVGAATEACLSAAELIGQVERRAERLGAVAADHPALAAFMADGFAPRLQAAIERVGRGYAARGLAVDGDIASEARTLSPSDFGFHNAIRRPDGALAFVDFEYFGWDDPVRVVCDFVLHPGMNLAPDQRRQFVAAMRGVFAADNDFPFRLDLLYPLVALRWCMILLNEFLPEKWQNRPDNDTHVGAETVKAAQATQLEKARVMLGRLDEPLMSPDDGR
jgi:hypothetical protein